MAKTFYQACFCRCEQDCYFFGCTEKEKCEQFKRFQKGEKLDAFGNIVEKAVENGV